MSGDQTVATEGWIGTAAAGPPPMIPPDAPLFGPAVSAPDMAAKGLSIAAGKGDAQDQAAANKGHTERTAGAAKAATQFPEQEAQSAEQMKALDPSAKGDQGSQMAQQIPQMLSSVMGAATGALGGLMQPLTQIPQQLAQTGQQLMGSMKDMGGKTPEELGAEGLGGGLPEGEDASKLGEGGGGGSGSGGSGGGGIGSTTPTAMLGPPATPSAATTPTAGRTMPAAPAPSGPPPSAPMTGMGGMGGMPHGGMGGGGGEGKDDKAATKRVAVPSIKNGAPVQGRIATPPSAPTVAKKVDGKTVASKRIVIPSDRANDKTEGDDKDR
jgi:hypothetical protein